MLDPQMDWSSFDHLWDLLSLTSISTSGIIHFLKVCREYQLR